MNGVTLAQALAVQTQMKMEMLDAEKVEPIRFGAYALQWCEVNAKRWKKSTKENYALALENHILPFLGDHFIDRITPNDLRSWLSNCGQNQKAITINGWFRVLKVILKDALGEGVIDRDPSTRVKTLPQSKPHKPSLTIDELSRFLKASKISTPKHYALFTVGFYTGARWGELTSLTWDDIDTSEAIVYIRRSHYQGVVGTTKTGKTRTVPLPWHVIEVISSHRRRMIAEQHPGLQTGLVFPADTDPALSRHDGYRLPSSVRKAIVNVCKLANITKHVTPHTMRRTFNNLMRQAGINQIALRAMVGHSSEEMTEHYSHVDIEERRSAIREFSDRLENNVSLAVSLEGKKRKRQEGWNL